MAELVQGRACGGCTACCKTHGVSEINKPGGKWCQYCNIGRGCTIYASRPESCKGFLCDWLKGFGCEEDRPDKRRVILDYCVKEDHPDMQLDRMLQIWEVTEGALKSRFVSERTNKTLANGICVVHIPISGTRSLFLAKGFEATDAEKRMIEKNSQNFRVIGYNERAFRL